MKKKSFKCELSFFICIHVLLIALCIVHVVKEPVNISTSFLDVVPDLDVTPGFAKASRAITDSSNNTISIYIVSSDYSQALSCARSISELLEKNGVLSRTESEISGESFIGQAIDFFAQKSAFLLPQQCIEEIQKSPQQFSMNRLALAFSPFLMTGGNNIDKDPFLLTEDVMSSYIQKASDITPFTYKDGFLVSDMPDGQLCIMLSGKAEPKLMSVSGGGLAESVFSIADEMEAEFPLCSVYTSGFPLHADQSASSARKEITLITVISVTAMIAMFAYVCRNVHVIWMFISGVALSFVCGAASVLIVFREVHVMTLIFGTTLIGTCIDYAIHFYIAYARRKQNEDSFDVRRGIFRSLTVGFLSTELCYIALQFSGYALLRQISVFCASGLLSSYLSSVFFYPCIIRQSMVNRLSPAVKSSAPVLPDFLLPIAVVSAVLLVSQAGRIDIKNNISGLYTPSERLMESEREAGKITGYSSPLYAAVCGRSEQQALENAEKYSAKLENAGVSFISSSMFIPSEKTQKRSIEAVRLLIPYLKNQCDILGVPDYAEHAVELMYENGRDYVEFSDLPGNLRDMLSSLYIGQIDGMWYQGFVIRNCDDVAELRRITDECGFAVLFDTADYISSSLDSLTGIILTIFGAVMAVTVVSLTVLYGIKKGLRMFLAPFSVIAVSLGAAPLCGLSIDFFYAAGMVLVLGLGLDYIVFACDENCNGCFVSVTLSFITTQLSFGTLMFSSFRPVKIFASAVFFGILTAYLCAVFSQRSRQ